MKIKKLRKAVKRYVLEHNYRVIINDLLGMYNNMSDEEYLKLIFRAKLGYDLNLGNPKTFNEKIQWLKLYDRRPEYTMMVDKYKVREYVAEQLGEEYLIPLIGVWDDPDKIDFRKLPDKFVLKCNHNSGLGMCICRDKSKLNFENVRNQLRKGLKQDYYLHGREWPYKNVERKIIAEKYMEDNGELSDYKFMCFNGKVKCVFTCTERFSKDGLKVTFFDINWNRLPFQRHYPQSNKEIKRPLNFDLMVKFAEKLSSNLPFARIDFYEVSGKIYFGEITLFPGSGMEEFTPEEWDRKLGKWINI